MKGRAVMREGHRMREGIELHLDNRQIVSFVIGSLVVVGVVFSVGVLVGKQLAAGALTQAAEPGDPLAALDAKEKVRTGDGVIGTGEIPAPKPDALNYQRELTRPAPTVPAAEPPAPERPREAKAAEPAKELKPAKAVDEPPAKAPDVDEDEEPSRKEGLAAAFEKASSKAEGGGGGLTLQVASFPNRAEAEKLVSKLSAKGLSPYVVEADVPGKGRMFRVRAGAFASRTEAEEGIKAFKKVSALHAIIVNR